MDDGIVVPVMSYAFYNFYGLVGPTTKDVILADNIPISRYATIGLSLRQHMKEIASGGSFVFVLFAINPSDHGGDDFFQGAAIGNTSSITGSGATALLGFVNPAPMISGVPHPMGRLLLRATGTTSTPAALMGIFSADLILRSTT